MYVYEYIFRALGVLFMKIQAISPMVVGHVQRKSVNRVSSNPNQSPRVQFSVISFKGNPAKNSKQVAAYATESNYLGGIYKSGGLGDVAEALPEAMALHGKEFTGGADIDVRTFLPYYSFDNDKGQLYVVKKESVQKFKNKEQLSRDKDFTLVDSSYKLNDGERFAVITEAKDGNKVDKMFLLEDVGLDGTVKRVSKDSFEMVNVPFRTFKVDTNGARKDGMYLIHTPEMAGGKSAYGVFQKYANSNSNSSTAYGGTTAYGGAASSDFASAEKTFKGKHLGDLFFTEQIRAMQTSLENMGTEAHGKFVPQNMLLHDRFAYVMLSDATEKIASNDSYWKGIRYVPIMHNIGRAYQGVYANPLDFFRVIATEKDLEKLKASPHYAKILKIAAAIEKSEASNADCEKLYKFFAPYFAKYRDDFGCFNMTSISIATTKEYPNNVVPGNVSKHFGKETRDFATADIAKGLTKSLKEIEDLTVDVTNGSKPANMATDNPKGFFGTGKLNDIFKDIDDARHYVPFKKEDGVDKIFEAKKANKTNLINIIAEATENLKNDNDAVAKLFFGDKKMKDLRHADDKLQLSLGGLSKYSEGDKLFLSWGRPDPQKGMPITARAFRMFLEDSSIPLETRLHSKLLFGAGGGNDAFGKDHAEWKLIKEELKKIAEIEVDGKKGIFAGNACYVNGLFPNRLANCADVGIFTSRYEPCGITPFESYAAGAPVLSTNTGGAGDFVSPGKNGFLTKNPFMLNRDN